MCANTYTVVSILKVPRISQSHTHICVSLPTTRAGGQGGGAVPPTIPKLVCQVQERPVRQVCVTVGVCTAAVITMTMVTPGLVGLRLLGVEVTPILTVVISGWQTWRQVAKRPLPWFRDGIRKICTPVPLPTLLIGAFQTRALLNKITVRLILVWLLRLWGCGLLLGLGLGLGWVEGLAQLITQVWHSGKNDVHLGALLTGREWGQGGHVPAITDRGSGETGEVTRTGRCVTEVSPCVWKKILISSFVYTKSTECNCICYHSLILFHSQVVL